MMAFFDSAVQVKQFDDLVRMRESGVRHYVPEVSIDDIVRRMKAEMERR